MPPREAAVELRSTPPETNRRFSDSASPNASKRATPKSSNARTWKPRWPNRRAWPKWNCRARPANCARRPRPRWTVRGRCRRLIRNSTSARCSAPLGPVWVFGPNNFPFALQRRRGRGFCRRHCRGKSGHRQGHQFASGHVAPAGGGGLCRRDRDGSAARHGAADLSHEPRGRRTAGRRSAHWPRWLLPAAAPRD